MTKYVLPILMVLGCGQQTSVSGPGANPSYCSVTQLQVTTQAPGGALIKCTDGSQALILNGVAGAPGAAVTPVQLCPGTTTYPSTFTEVAFCISNQLYAVYSANDGFLTLIPPGNYTSNGINSRCNLTVLSNCVVTN